MKYNYLGKTNLNVSTISLGGSQLGGHYENKIDEEKNIKTVETCFNNGINFIDTAPYYGKTVSESNLGVVLSKIKYSRNQYYIGTKIGRYDVNQFDFSRETVIKSVDESLNRLQLDYIDLIQCHDIEFTSLDQIVNETLPALHKLKEQGKVRYIGVTGLPLKPFRTVIDKLENSEYEIKIDTILTYCHYTLQNDSLTSLLPYLKDHGIGVINAGVLSMGLFTKQGPPSWHPANSNIKEACSKSVKYCLDAGERPEKLAVQYSLANEQIDTTLVGTAEPEEALNNIKWAEEFYANGVFPSKNMESLFKNMTEILAPAKNQLWASGLPENDDF